MHRTQLPEYHQWAAAAAKFREWARRDWLLTRDERQQRQEAEKKERIAWLRLVEAERKL